MFRRRWFGPLGRRPIVRGAMVGGLGYLLGRRAAGRDQAGTVGSTSQASVSVRLAELDRLRDAGQVTPEEYASKRAEILRDV